MHDDLSERERLLFEELSTDLCLLLEEIESEPMPERLLVLAGQLQAKLAERRRRTTLDS